MWWIFKKKEDKKWEQFHEHLKTSFSLVKEDINNIFSHVNIHKKETNEIFKLINQRLERLENIMIQKTGIQINEDQETILYKPKEEEWNSLTNKQQEIIQVLGKLQNEGLKEWISLKELVREMYPEKKYEKIRPLISDYLTILVEYGMVKRKSRRKQTYASITKKGFAYQQNYIKTKKLLKLIIDKE